MMVVSAMKVWITSDQMVSITEANQNFSRVARLVDEKKSVVVMKNNRPAYVILEFDAYEQGKAESQRFEHTLDKVITEDAELLKRLAE